MMTFLVVILTGVSVLALAVIGLEPPRSIRTREA